MTQKAKKKKQDPFAGLLIIGLIFSFGLSALKLMLAILGILIVLTLLVYSW